MNMRVSGFFPHRQIMSLLANARQASPRFAALLPNIAACLVVERAGKMRYNSGAIGLGAGGEQGWAAQGFTRGGAGSS